MYNDLSTPALTDVDFISNQATDSGGGMLNDDSSSTLTTVTFTGNSADVAGGGMYNGGSAPTLTDVTFELNTAESGAGMANFASSPDLTDVTFSTNTADYGGGMYNSATSNPTLTDVTFGTNHGLFGGGMYSDTFSSPSLTDVTFDENSADSYGGGMYLETNSAPSLMNVTFKGNQATNYGGALYASAASPTLTNVTFNGNWAAYGGAVYAANGSNVALNHGTFSGNWATTIGGAMYILSSDATLDNSIFWDDAYEIYNPGSHPVIRDSIVFGGCPGGAVCSHVIISDPLLDILSGHGAGSHRPCPLLELQPGALTPSGLNATCAATDQRGIVRPQGLACDMGAYEYTYSFRSSDFDGDGKSDPVKYVPGTGTAWWLKSTTGLWDSAYLGSDVAEYVGRSDFDGDGRADPAKYVSGTQSSWYLSSRRSACRESTWAQAPTASCPVRTSTATEKNRPGEVRQPRLGLATAFGHEYVGRHIHRYGRSTGVARL